MAFGAGVVEISGVWPCVDTTSEPGARIRRGDFRSGMDARVFSVEGFKESSAVHRRVGFFGVLSRYFDAIHKQSIRAFT